VGNEKSRQVEKFKSIFELLLRPSSIVLDSRQTLFQYANTAAFKGQDEEPTPEKNYTLPLPFQVRRVLAFTETTDIFVWKKTVLSSKI